jgi:hypothetical protein
MRRCSRRNDVALRTRLPATSRPAAFKIFGSRDAATIRAGTVSLVANPQFSIQRSVIGAQFCLRRKSVLRFRPPSIVGF